MNRTHYEITRPMDWQDKLILQACWWAAGALVMILAYTS